MSASCVSFRSESDNDYAIDFRGSFEKITKQNRRPQYRRSSTPPVSVNGIHRRRNSRWTWGHLRGAQSQNVLAFARCALAAAAALCASATSAGVISFGTSAAAYNLVPIGNPGNVANPSAPTGTPNVRSLGGGSVAYLYEIGATEVTNSQYAYFLNSVAKTDTYNLFNSSMRISRTGSAGNWSYSTTPANANRPVGWVSALDTFRFANWMQNGMPTTGVQNASTTENGVYNMALSQPIRQAGASFWIPSVNEWYKAAYYNPTLNSGSGGYMLYPVNSNSIVSGTAPGGATTASIANAYNGSINVGSYTSATSFYGAFDMAGNVSERLDTISGSSYTYALSHWVSPASQTASNSSTTFNVASIGGEQAQLGFRIAAVPEPSTIVLAGMGAASAFIGLNRKKLKRVRRRA